MTAIHPSILGANKGERTRNGGTTRRGSTVTLSRHDETPQGEGKKAIVMMMMPTTTSPSPTIRSTTEKRTVPCHTGPEFRTEITRLADHPARPTALGCDPSLAPRKGNKIKVQSEGGSGDASAPGLSLLKLRVVNLAEPQMCSPPRLAEHRAAHGLGFCTAAF